MLQEFALVPPPDSRPEFQGCRYVEAPLLLVLQLPAPPGGQAQGDSRTGWWQAGRRKHQLPLVHTDQLLLHTGVPLGPAASWERGAKAVIIQGPLRFGVCARKES